MRDFEFHDNDLIVATHGRGFWVIDDISALRQIDDAVSRADAYLFKPADAINLIAGRRQRHADCRRTSRRRRIRRTARSSTTT